MLLINSHKIFHYSTLQITSDGVEISLTVWLQPFLGVEKGLEHTFVEQHVTHRLRDDDVNQLGQLDLFDLTRDYTDTIRQKIVLHQSLKQQ